MVAWMKRSGIRDNRNHNCPQNTEWMAMIPDLEDRLILWRVATKRSANGSTDECQTQPNTLAPLLPSQPFAAAAVAPPTKPQHSLAQTIFRKQQVVIQLYDAGVADGDIVTLYLNNKIVRSNVLLLPPPGVTLEPSPLLWCVACMPSPY